MPNSVDPDEVARYESSHLDLHCLHKYLCWSAELNLRILMEDSTKMDMFYAQSGFSMHFTLWYGRFSVISYKGISFVTSCLLFCFCARNEPPKTAYKRTNRLISYDSGQAILHSV